MKLRQKLIVGYIGIAIVMIVAGYSSVKIYIDIRKKVVELTTDSMDVFGNAEDLIRALEHSQKSMSALINNKPKIVYTYSLTSSDVRKAAGEHEQIAQKLKTDLDKLESLLSPLIKITRDDKGSDKNNSLHSGDEKLKDLLALRKKHFYYHWKYLSHFINLAEEFPDQADTFFEKTLEPHYRENILPVIQGYWESKKDARERKIGIIVKKYIPNASVIIIASTTLTLISIFFLGLWVSHTVSMPLRQLTDAAEEIGKGQLKTRIDINSHDEVGILANAFNRMALDLSKTTVSKTYVDNIIESMLDTLIVLNPDTTIRTINNAALSLLGYSESEIIGKPITDILIESNSGIPILNVQNTKDSQGNLEKIYLSKLGERIPVTVSQSVMLDENDEIDGIVCVARDIRERKRTEIALKTAYNELERRVDERTVELLSSNMKLKKEIAERKRTEDALRQSEKRLRKLSSHIITAQERERRRISMELHDDLGQSLSLLKVQLSSIQNEVANDEIEVLSYLQETRQYLDFIIENVRRLSKDLSPSVLEDLGLTAAIEWLINDFSKHCKLDIIREIEPIDNFLPLENHIILYRIFQEIMANIAKHSYAKQVHIQIKSYKKVISILVSDDGKGFDLNRLSTLNASEKGMGLAAMQERILMLGSSLNIETVRGKGTRIKFKIPFGKEELV